MVSVWPAAAAAFTGRLHPVDIGWVHAAKCHEKQIIIESASCDCACAFPILDCLLSGPAERSRLLQHIDRLLVGQLNEAYSVADRGTIF